MNNSEKDILLQQLQVEIADVRLKQLNQEIEDKTKKEKRKSLNSVNTPILVALLSILGAIVVNIIQQRANNKLEEQKLKSSLVLKALDAGDTSKVSKTLLWFVKNKLIEDGDSVITRAAKNSSELPVLLGFNVNSSDLPTLMVTNITKGGGCESGPGAGCWKKTITAETGDIIAIQVYFHNESEYLAQAVALGIKPEISSKDTLHIFVGGVASTTIPRSTGYVTIQTASPSSIKFIPGTVRVYKHGQKIGYTINNEASLFENGFLIGDVSPGYDTQGVLVAQFKVSNE